MIVKHETRIRTLETKNKEQEKQLMSQVGLCSLSRSFKSFLLQSFDFTLSSLCSSFHSLSSSFNCSHDPTIWFLPLSILLFDNLSLNPLRLLILCLPLQGIHLNNNGHSGEDLDPDEVWQASDLDGHWSWGSSWRSPWSPCRWSPWLWPSSVIINISCLWCWGEAVSAEEVAFWTIMNSQPTFVCRPRRGDNINLDAAKI